MVAVRAARTSSKTFSRQQLGGMPADGALSGVCGLAFDVKLHQRAEQVQAVFDGPVAAYDVPEVVNRRHRHRSDIVACFTLDFSADFAAALDDDQAFEARPTMALPEPLDVVDDGRGSGLDAAMVAITTVVSRLISVSTNPLAFCSVTNSSASSRSEPWLPFSART